MEADKRTRVVIDRAKWSRITAHNDSSGGVVRLQDGFVTRYVGPDDAPCLLNPTGTMCCLGFVVQTLLQNVCSPEKIEQLLLNTGTPRGVLYRVRLPPPPGCGFDPETLVKALGPLLHVEGTDGSLLVRCANSNLANKAMDLNDLIGFTETRAVEVVRTREQKLTEAFAVYGIDLVFEGEDCTNGSQQTNEGGDRS